MVGRQAFLFFGFRLIFRGENVKLQGLHPTWARKHSGKLTAGTHPTRFGSDDFPDFNGAIFLGCMPFIFQRVCWPNNKKSQLEKVDSATSTLKKISYLSWICYSSMQKEQCSKHILPSGVFFHGDESHGIESVKKTPYQCFFLVPIKGGRWHIIPQLAVYTTYIPFGGLYNPYHLLPEPEKSIDLKSTNPSYM